jgi:hypothetical protein
MANDGSKYRTQRRSGRSVLRWRFIANRHLFALSERVTDFGWAKLRQYSPTYFYRISRLSEQVLTGIRRNDLWILIHSEYREGVQQRCEVIPASFPDDAAPPERVTAEAMVVRRPLFVAECARRLAQGK